MRLECKFIAPSSEKIGFALQVKFIRFFRGIRLRLLRSDHRNTNLIDLLFDELETSPMIESSIVYRDFKGKYEFFPLSRAEGAVIWNREGQRYIDFSSGWNITNLGWNNPEITEAMIVQAKKNVHGLLWGSDIIQEEYAAAITSSLPSELNACIKATSGTEAIEVSIKIARTFTNRKKIIGFDGHYHGQLFASLAVGAPASKRPKLAPFVPEIEALPFPHQDIGEEKFEKFLIEFEDILSHENVAAVVAEAGIITGWGSTQIAHSGFLKKVRELTQKYGTLLIVDEVGTGFSRTGKLFAIEHENVTPDIIVFAKAIANGAAAIATAVGRAEIFDAAFTDAVLISSFGWTPVAAAAALKTLQIHKRDATWKMAEAKGARIMESMQPFIGEKIRAVQGLGMEIGVRFKDAACCERVQKKAFSLGLHVIVGSLENMQIMPPLIISDELLDEGLGILSKAINETL